jgi:DNA topoisomerase-3
LKTLVLAEKPSVGKDLAHILGCRNSSRSYIEGPNYIVTWAMGHLAELADPGEYNQDWKEWKLEVLPTIPEKFRLSLIGRTRKQFNEIKKLLHRSDVSEVIIATDAGREGELVARWILRLAGNKKKMKRLWISSYTQQAVKTGFSQLKNSKEYDSLYYAAQSRAEADWIIGLNVSRALSTKYDARLSAGRVQTPTLGFLIQREKKRKNFVPKKYWNLQADFGAYTGLYRDEKNNPDFFDFESMQTVKKDLEGKSGIIVDVKESIHTSPPPLAYDLTALQRDANRMYGYSAKKTLDIVQTLYERRKILSYPRTDSRYITSDMVSSIPDRIKALAHTPLQNFVKHLDLSKVTRAPKWLVNDAKVSDHHAIIPTEEPVHWDQLDSDEKSIFTLAASRFLQTLSEPFKYEVRTLVTKVGEHSFFTKGHRTLSMGWKAVVGGASGEDGLEEDFQSLGVHRKGEEHEIHTLKHMEKETQPPALFTEATLLEAMEKPYKFMKHPKLKELESGLGTPATRADIIEKLLSSHLMERDGKSLVPGGKGFELWDLVPESLKSPVLTAEWEAALESIAKGSLRSKEFMNRIIQDSRKLVSEVSGSKLKFTPRNLSNKDCPLCGRKLMNTKDKKSNAILVCPSRSCGYEEGSGQKGASQNEKRIARREMKNYGHQDREETFSLADMIKAKNQKRSKK